MQNAQGRHVLPEWGELEEIKIKGQTIVDPKTANQLPSPPRRRPEQRRAVKVRDMLVSNGQRVCHGPKFKWTTPEKSTLPSVSTIFSIHLSLTVFMQSNSQTEEISALQNISVSILPPQLFPCHSPTYPRPVPHPSLGRNKAWCKEGNGEVASVLPRPFRLHCLSARA